MIDLVAIRLPQSPAVSIEDANLSANSHQLLTEQ